MSPSQSSIQRAGFPRSIEVSYLLYLFRISPSCSAMLSRDADDDGTCVLVDTILGMDAVKDDAMSDDEATNNNQRIIQEIFIMI